jgi:hypothetical protein
VNDEKETEELQGGDFAREQEDLCELEPRAANIGAWGDVSPAQRAKHSSKSNEWFTPAVYIEAAREVLGEIDLDPASCEQANRVVKATRFYTKEDDGLKQPWSGRVYCNPPYGRTNGKSNLAVWTEKLLAEYGAGNVTAAIMLVNAEPGTKWFQPLWWFPLCFTDHRIKFYTASGEPNAPTHSNCFVYLPPRDVWAGDYRPFTPAERFARVFNRFGACIDPNGVRLPKAG